LSYLFQTHAKLSQNFNKNTAGLIVSANIATSGLEQRSKMNNLEISMGLARNVRAKLTV